MAILRQSLPSYLEQRFAQMVVEREAVVVVVVIEL